MDILPKQQYIKKKYTFENHLKQISISDSPLEDTNKNQNDIRKEKKAHFIQKYPPQIKQTKTKINYKAFKWYKNKEAQEKPKQFIVQDKIYSVINPNQIIQLFSGCYITREGLIRFCYSICQVVFGYQQTGASQVRQDNNLGVVDIELQQSNIVETKPMLDALQHFYNIPNQTYHKITQQLYIYQDNLKFFLQQIYQINITEELLTQKDHEFYQFCKDCYSFLKQYKKDNPFTMFQFGIGRFNLRKNDFEFKRAGYSLAYLQLLGLDSSSFASMLLRRKEVNLLRNEFETLNLSLIGLNNRNYQLKDESYVCYIKTFDGFPVKLYQTKRNFTIPSQMSKKQNVFNEFTFYLTEFDIDTNDLQNLIKYRKKIYQKNQCLTINEFIEKELSYQFQDIEYSVISQNFIDKYYAQNIQQISEFEEQYVQSKQCGYRLINKK